MRLVAVKIMNKTYYISQASQTGGFNLVTGKEKVSETTFNDLLSAKLKELLGEQIAQYDECLKQVTEALEQKKPVTILDRCFEIKFSKAKLAS